MSETELPPGIKRLRRVVIIMGFVLVIGTILVFIAALIKFSHKSAAPVSSYAMAVPSKNENCSFKTLANIELAGDIINSGINGNMLTLVTRNGKVPKQEIVVFDLCKGEVLSRVNVIY